MKTLIDTTIWSLAYRRKLPDQSIATALTDLLNADDALIIGVIRQEFLSAIHDPIRFQKLRNRLAKLEDTPNIQADYELAAEYHNICRGKGIQGSPPDFLLCATSTRLRAPIFTTDQDFHLYAKHLPITLYHPA